MITSNQQPATSNQQPATSNQQPATSNQQPATSNQQPATSNQQPATSNQQPATSNQQPATSNQQPATSNQQPATSNQQPATSNQQPATSNQQPATSNQQPATSNQHKKSRVLARAKPQLTRFTPSILSVLISSLAVVSPLTIALTISEDFTGTKTTNNWRLPLTGGGANPNDACLTAGNNSNMGSATVAGSPPKCSSIKEAAGKGALRLTPVQTNKTGGIVSNFTFPTNEGIEISFVSYTYGGTGADGLSFFLTDGAEDPSLGAAGGSLGYSCANSNGVIKGQGIIGGYLGLGIDEYGNFLNQGDNTSSGFGARPGRIGLRGAGSINWTSLNRRFPTNYPATTPTAHQITGVERTCTTGQLHRYTGGGNNWTNTRVNVDFNYPALAGGFTNLNNVTTPIGSKVSTRAEARPINYRLRITPAGLLSLWWSYNGGQYQPILVDRDIIATNGPLPTSFRFGFVASTGASTNNHEITCFKAAPATMSDNSAAISLPEGEYKTDSQIYISVHNPNNWWSSLTSQNLAYSSTTGVITVNPLANWDASCALTGGFCNKTGGNKVVAQSPEKRSMITYSGSEGTPFQWESGISDTQKALLNTGDNSGELRLNYLRGDRSQELKNNGTGRFRARTSVLGDIINSSPAWVGPPSMYAKQATWTDKLTGSTMPENASSAQTYADFKSKYNDRLNVLYVGANDGFLHGFRTGAYDSTGKIYQSSNTDKPNDGKEVLAYIPAAVLKRIHNATNGGLDFSSPNYAHNYFNDSAPGTGELFYNGKWHTWLMSGLGSGGATIYALDVTDPQGTQESSKNFTEDNAANLVIGEWSHDATSAIWKYLGNTYGTPEIRRFHNGQWGAVFGNGWCEAADAANGNCASPNGQAGIYIMLVDETTGVPSFQFLNTGVGTAASPNGIAYVTPMDLDDDQIVDYVYAGDIQGNVWRFDLTDSSSSTWASSTSLFKLFSTPSGQPITTKLSVSYNKNKKNKDPDPRLMINFGTGKKTNGYLENSSTYTSSTQSMYGIWDWNFKAWNANAKTTKKYAKVDSGSLIAKSMLAQQTVNATTNILSDNTVCWSGSTACSVNKHFGWYMDLSSPEQIIYSPIVSDEANAMIVNTFIPGREQTISCEVTPPSGFTYALDPTTGQGKHGFWTGKFSDAGTRLPLAATGSPSLITVNGKLIMLTKDSKGDVIVTPVYIPGKGKVLRRLSWRELF